jgi:hypothetical protein
MFRSYRSLGLWSLLASMTLSGCVSPAPTVSDGQARGYDLRVDGDELSLAFVRALTMPEFLRLAQEVTSARYVYNGDQIATTGPVTLAGRIQCKRSEFPAFVGTMLHIHGLQAQVRGTGDLQYVEILPVANG